MKDVDLVNLKKLAFAVADAPQGSAAWDKATDALFKKFNAGGLVALIEQLEAAQRERDEWKEHSDKVYEAFHAAEAEIKRRDEQEPVAWTDDTGLKLLQETFGVTVQPTQKRGGSIPLYAAPAAALSSEELYRIANHIAGAKGGLPDEWQDWAEEIESDLRRVVSAANSLEEAGVKYKVKGESDEN